MFNDPYPVIKKPFAKFITISPPSKQSFPTRLFAVTARREQSYLTQELGRYGFVNKNQWPPKSPDLNPLDYHFWNALKVKVYEGRREPFTSIEQLKRRVKRVWDSAINMEQVQKSVVQFKKRLRAVMDTQGGPINHKFR